MSRAPCRPPTWHAPPGPETITLKLKLITPMFGGGYETRCVDPLMPIRPAAIRGHLRFWWRATAGARYRTVQELFQAEEEIWGSMTQPGKVRIAVKTLGSPTVQADNVDMQASEAYALWPARETGGDNPQPPAQRVKEGMSFRVRIDCPSLHEAEVKATVTAWTLFGGIGGRTRRGCGALAVTGVVRNRSQDDMDGWVPATACDISKILATTLAVRRQAPPHAPILFGATLYIGQPTSALEAWYEALKWLKEFRQGSNKSEGDRAREPDPTRGNRPSVSNWPEADKVRHQLGNPTSHAWAHPPRHNATPVWPRAGFGLPIVGQFQQQSRQRDPNDPRGRRNLRWNQLAPPTYEPRAFEIIWRDQQGNERDRLASPLIVKPLALGNDQYVPCALWLNRADPPGGPCLRGQPGSGAAYGTLVAQGDTALYSPLTESTLRDAFFTWVCRNFTGVTQVLP